VADGSFRPDRVRRPDPVMFLGYWGNEEATRAKFIGDWMVTGDQGVRDADGYFSFFGRDDDVITSSGYRIGPGEIENCLTGHPAVALAAAVGKPDPVRTEIVKAYVVVVPGIKPDEALSVSIRDWVKTRLSAHEYPREIEFVDESAADHNRQGGPAPAQGQGHRRGECWAERPNVDRDQRRAMPRIFRAAAGRRCGCCDRCAAGLRLGGHRGRGSDRSPMTMVPMDSRSSRMRLMIG
jgi:hypothetical protein